MDLKKTGRLITKRRKEMGLTMRELSEKLLVSASAVCAWEKGNRYPDPASQVMIEKEMGLNPVELMTGLEMYDDKLKKGISDHMSRTDEKVFTGGIITDEDGNESYFDMSGFMVVGSNENGELSDQWIPYLEYHNAEPHVMTDRERELKAKEDAVPEEEFDPMKVYINFGSAIFIISREILEAIGSPKHFIICHNKEEECVGLKFGDDGDFDIPEEVYDGHGAQGRVHGREEPCKGLMIYGGEFGKDLCHRMGISEMQDRMIVVPKYLKEKNLLLLELMEAKRVKPNINLNDFVLPTWQFEQKMQELEDEE